MQLENSAPIPLEHKINLVFMFHWARKIGENKRSVTVFGQYIIYSFYQLSDRVTLFKKSCELHDPLQLAWELCYEYSINA